ncbi:MAG: substrate-binding domain-containing protein, partial [Spirochaetota bacterium]
LRQAASQIDDLSFHLYQPRNVGYITGDRKFRNAIDRLACFESLAREFGMGSQVVEGNFSRTSGYRGAARLLESAAKPTVIMTSSDRAALGVLSLCVERGIHVPGELSVIGYDNLYPAEDVNPSLSTVDNPISASGKLAAEILIAYLEGGKEWPRQEWLVTGFVVRESTGPGPGYSLESSGGDPSLGGA